MASLLDPPIGAALLSELGFLHVPGRPVNRGRAYLFVAIRARPTLRHFDPERVDYWTEHDGRGFRAAIDHTCGPAVDDAFAWGGIRIVDRTGVFNDWVSFGGRLTRQRIDDVDVCVFSSEAPIAAHGGHSQGFDPLAAEMAGFVARLRAAAGTDRSFEAELAGSSPVALYAAFVNDELARHRLGRASFDDAGPVADVLLSERQALQADAAAADWAAGERLAQQLERLARPTRVG